MKSFITILLITFCFIGCKKGNEITTTSNQNQPEKIKPVAGFRINNLVSSDLILEGNIVDFENQSENADSYYWDFGNGVHSTEKIPQNIIFVPCGGHYTISLVVKNTAGESKSEQSFVILCRGRSAHRTGAIKPIHLSTSQITALGYERLKSHA